MGVKLSGSLPEIDRNGLDVLHGDLVRHPDRRHLIVAVIDCATTSINHQNGKITPTAGIVFVEPIRDRDDIAEITETLARVRAERVNGGTLDFDFGIEDPLAEAAQAMRDAGVTVVSFGKEKPADGDDATG